MNTETVYGDRPSGRIPGRSTPPRPLHRTQAVKSDRTTFIVVNESSRMTHCGQSLEKARTETLRTSIHGLAHLYRLDGTGRLSQSTPIATYVDGKRL